MPTRATEIKLRAERKAGALLAEMDKAKNQSATNKTLAAIGVSHIQSSRWQRAAVVPEDSLTLSPRGDRRSSRIWKFCHEQSEAFRAEKRRIADNANRKCSDATKERGREYDGTLKAGPVEEQNVPALDGGKPEREAKAAASKTNAGAVSRGDLLAKDRPDLPQKWVRPATIYGPTNAGIAGDGPSDSEVN